MQVVVQVSHLIPTRLHVETFNKYLEDNDLPKAFRNSDFVRIYKRIVGDLKDNDTLKNWMEEGDE